MRHATRPHGASAHPGSGFEARLEADPRTDPQTGPQTRPQTGPPTDPQIGLGSGRGDDARIAEWVEFAGRVGARAAIRVWRARGFAARLRGLVARPLPGPGCALWIEPCAAVHTFGVRGPLDLVFVSSCMVVQRIDAAVPVGRVRGASGARAVMELQAGEAARVGLRVGARLAWRHGTAAASEAAPPMAGG